MRRLAWLAWAPLALSCTDFDRVDRNVCGNKIVEPDRLEDCDEAPLEQDGVSYACGEPGSANQCRLLCNEDERACPDGWACQPETGICRENASGRFAFTSTVRVTRLRRIAVADVDRDGDDDLLTNADATDDDIGRISVHHFDADGEVAQSLLDPFETRATAPIVAGPLGDRRGDEISLLVPGFGYPGFTVLRGRNDGSLLPGLVGRTTGFGDDIVLVPHVNNNLSGTFGFQPALAPLTGMTLSGGLADLDHNTILDGQLTFALDADLDGQLPAPIFDAGRINMGIPQLSEVSYVLLGVPGESFARLYDRPQGRTWPHFDIELPEGRTIASDGGALFGDVNGDGFIDALLLADDGNTYLSYNDGFGAFTSSLDLFEPDWATSPDPAIVGAFPIAAGHIDGDELVDFVFSEFGMALTNPEDIFTFVDATVCPQLSSALASTYACINGFGSGGFDPNSAERWSSAAIADMNDDGRPDVVVNPEDANQLDIYYFDEFNLPKRQRIQTPARVREFALADLNNDLVNDVLFYTSGSDAHRVYSSRGRRSEGPTAPQLLFEAPEIISLRAQPLGGVWIAWRDERGRAQVGHNVPDPNADRSVSIARVPCPGDGVGSDLPLQLVMGRFDEHPGHDAAMLYQDCYVPVGSSAIDQLVLYPSGANATIGAVFDDHWDPSVCEVGGLLSCQQGRSAAHPESLELDGTLRFSRDALLIAVDVVAEEEDARDELVMITPTGDATSEMVIAALDPDPPGLQRFEVVRTASLAARIGGNVEQASVSRGSSALTDVDGDGDQDLVVLTTDAAGPRLVVFANDDDGLRPTFDEVVFSTPTEGDLTAFTIADADYDLKRDDLFVAIGGTVFVVYDAFAGGATAERIEVPGLLDLDEVIVDDLASGDFDADGLLDLAVMIDDDVRILRGLPVKP